MTRAAEEKWLLNSTWLLDWRMASMLGRPTYRLVNLLPIADFFETVFTFSTRASRSSSLDAETGSAASVTSSASRLFNGENSMLRQPAQHECLRAVLRLV
jgi:hypothetical protein